MGNAKETTGIEAAGGRTVVNGSEARINSMIAQLADTQPPGEVEKLKSDNKELQRRVEELEVRKIT
ncbi:unnamed protein product [Strongylus vulgaris]|uniref:Uncharacterized protein n=1 Tax=Strongylus vulgaris TaxID=40348 RepID=A0A3P7KA69_STRVU|nr:unnamed protein product [Strongylus vulgaris]